MALYNRILTKFPPKILFSFAYGSAVKTQLGYKAAPRMVDLIFCVEDAVQWHAENLAKNKDHYSLVRCLGSSAIAKIQRNFGSQVYCNTLIPLPDEGLVIKYGVVSADDLLNDLNCWRHLYLSGRLHKPVTIITNPPKNLKAGLESNLGSALRTALLLLPAKFSKFDLFYTISNLSYSGDFRMIFGENKNKVKNIVEPQISGFYELYQPIIALLPNQIHLVSEDSFEQDKSIDATEEHFQKLPINLREKIISNCNLKGPAQEIMREISQQKNFTNVISKSVNQIVWRSSVLQSLKNIPTAGFSKSILYSWNKTMKTFAS